MRTGLALLSILLLVSAACVGNRARSGTAAQVTSPSSGPILVVENQTGKDYEVFVMLVGFDRGRLLGRVGALQNTPLPLVDVPPDGTVRFRARPLGGAIAVQDFYSEYDNDVLSEPVKLTGGRQVTWRLGPPDMTQVTYETNP